MKKLFLCKECKSIRREVRNDSTSRLGIISDCIDNSLVYKNCNPGVANACFYKKNFLQKINSWNDRYFKGNLKTCIAVLEYFSKFDIRALQDLHLMRDGPNVFTIIEKDSTHDHSGKAEQALFELIRITEDYGTTIKEIFDMQQLSLLDCDKGIIGNKDLEIL